MTRQSTEKLILTQQQLSKLEDGEKIVFDEMNPVIVIESR